MALLVLSQNIVMKMMQLHNQCNADVAMLPSVAEVC